MRRVSFLIAPGDVRSACMEEQPASADTKTCPMCAEDVKAAAVLCRFCGHRFDLEPVTTALPATVEEPTAPQPPPPETLTSALATGEDLFVWTRCSWGGFHSGALGITSDRVLFLADLGPEQSITHRLAENREATVWDNGTVRIDFADAMLTFVGLDATLAREIGGTVAPSLAERFFADDSVMMDRLRTRQAKIAERASATAPPAPTATAVVKGCKYLGGFSQLRPGGRFVRFSIHFRPNEIVVQTMGKPAFRVSQPKTCGVSIEGREELQQRLTATRMVGLGVFSLAAPKRSKRATSYITIGLTNGETGIFEVENADPMKLRARLSPWLAEH